MLSRSLLSPAPVYQPGQKVWLSSRNLPLQVESSKLDILDLGYIGPFEVEKIINTSAVRLKLPDSLKIHPTFHISLLQPGARSTLSPPAKPTTSAVTLVFCPCCLSSCLSLLCPLPSLCVCVWFALGTASLACSPGSSSHLHPIGLSTPV